jgi:hypothetical protein
LSAIVSAFITALIFLVPVGVNAQYVSPYDSKGSVKTVEQRRFEESQNKTKIVPAVANKTSTSAKNTNSPATTSPAPSLKTILFGDKRYSYYGDWDMNGLLEVERSNKKGFINKEGKEIIPVKYDAVGKFNNGQIKVELKNSAYGETSDYYDKSGKRLTADEYSKKEKEAVKYVPVSDPYSRSGYDVNQSDNLPAFKYTFSTGEEAARSYQAHEGFFEGLARVSNSRYINSTTKAFYGYIDEKGREVVPLIYDSAASQYYEGFAEVKINGTWGYINKTGKEITPFKYSSARNFSQGRAFVQLNGKWGFIDTTGTVIAPLIYDVAYSGFYNGLAGVGLNKKLGFIDRSGTVIIPLIYDYIDQFKDNELATVKLNGKWGCIDKTGMVIIPLIYDWVNVFYTPAQSWVIVILNGKYGTVDRTGNVIIPIIYDDLAVTYEPDGCFGCPPADGKIIAELKGKKMFLDKTGKKIKK